MSSHRRPAPPTGRAQSGPQRQAGLVTLEYVLLVLGLSVPFALAVYQIVKLIARYFSFVSWSVLLPFP